MPVRNRKIIQIWFSFQINKSDVLAYCFRTNSSHQLSGVRLMNMIKWQLTITHQQHLFGVQKHCPSSGATVGWHGTSRIDAIIPKHQSKYNVGKSVKPGFWQYSALAQTSLLQHKLFCECDLSKCKGWDTIVTVYSTHQMVSKCNKVLRDPFTFRYIIAHIYIQSHCWKCRASQLDALR